MYEMPTGLEEVLIKKGGKSAEVGKKIYEERTGVSVSEPAPSSPKPSAPAPSKPSVTTEPTTIETPTVTIPVTTPFEQALFAKGGASAVAGRIQYEKRTGKPFVFPPGAIQTAPGAPVTISERPPGVEKFTLPEFKRRLKVLETERQAKIGEAETMISEWEKHIGEIEESPVDVKWQQPLEGQPGAFQVFTKSQALTFATKQLGEATEYKAGLIKIGDIREVEGMWAWDPKTKVAAYDPSLFHISKAGDVVSGKELDIDFEKGAVKYSIDFPYVGAEKYGIYKKGIEERVGQAEAMGTALGERIPGISPGGMKSVFGMASLVPTAFLPKDPLGIVSAFYQATGQKEKALEIKIGAVHDVSVVEQAGGVFTPEFAKFWFASPLTQLGLAAAGGMAYGSAGKALSGGLLATAAPRIIIAGKVVMAGIGVGLVAPATVDIYKTFERGETGEALGKVTMMGLQFGMFAGGIKAVAGYKKMGLTYGERGAKWFLKRQALKLGKISEKKYGGLTAYKMDKKIVYDPEFLGLDKGVLTYKTWRGDVFTAKKWKLVGLSPERAGVQRTAIIEYFKMKGLVGDVSTLKTSHGFMGQKQFGIDFMRAEALKGKEGFATYLENYWKASKAELMGGVTYKPKTADIDIWWGRYRYLSAMAQTKYAGKKLKFDVMKGLDPKPFVSKGRVITIAGFEQPSPYLVGGGKVAPWTKTAATTAESLFGYVKLEAAKNLPTASTLYARLWVMGGHPKGTSTGLSRFLSAVQAVEKSPILQSSARIKYIWEHKTLGQMIEPFVSKAYMKYVPSAIKEASFFKYIKPDQYLAAIGKGRPSIGVAGVSKMPTVLFVSPVSSFKISSRFSSPLISKSLYRSLGSKSLSSSLSSSLGVSPSSSISSRSLSSSLSSILSSLSSSASSISSSISSSLSSSLSKSSSSSSSSSSSISSSLSSMQRGMGLPFFMPPLGLGGRGRRYHDYDLYGKKYKFRKRKMYNPLKDLGLKPLL